MAYEPLIFKDREEAGMLLGEKLAVYKDTDPVVFSIPRGGVSVGYKVAEYLECPLDVVVARKLAMSERKNFAFGAISPGDVITIDRSLQSALQISDAILNEIIHREMQTMNRLMLAYNSGSYAPQENLSTVIIIDDGCTTGLAARAAVETIKIFHNPQHIIFASPVCAKDTASILQEAVDDIVCLNHPPHLFAIDNWYEDFEKVTDEEIKNYLETAKNLILEPHYR